MIDVSKFSGDPILQQALTEVNDITAKAAALIQSPLPATVYAHVKAHMEQSDTIAAEIVQKSAELSMAMHLKKQSYQKTVKDRTEEAWDDYGRNRFFAENIVNGDAEVADMNLVIKCLGSAIDSLEALRWLITRNKDHVVQMFEKTK